MQCFNHTQFNVYNFGVIVSLVGLFCANLLCARARVFVHVLGARKSAVGGCFVLRFYFSWMVVESQVVLLPKALFIRN